MRGLLTRARGRRLGRSLPGLSTGVTTSVKRALIAVSAIAVLVLLVTAGTKLIPPLVRALSPSVTMDGLTWRKVHFSTPSYTLRTVVAGGPGFVAAGSNEVWTSVDGDSWSRVPDEPTSGVFFNAYIDTLTVAHGRLYAGGDGRCGGACVWVSADGVHWKERALPQPPLSDFRVAAFRVRCRCRLTGCAGRGSLRAPSPRRLSAAIASITTHDLASERAA